MTGHTGQFVLGYAKVKEFFVVLLSRRPFHEGRARSGKSQAQRQYNSGGSRRRPLY
jgi:hypothetical protein